MKKPSKIEMAYHALERIASGQMTQASVDELRCALGGTTSLLASKAADIAGRKGARELIPDMISAFDRFMTDGAHTDKQCNAKISIVNALDKLEYMGDEVFIRGASYVQMEPAFGKPVDTAVELRCGCAYGLARIGHPDAHFVLADLLVDSERAVRTAAVKALAYIGSPESEVLLRLKVLTGDAELDVTSECFTGLMIMSPERSLDFVARYLRSYDHSLVECAALALGGSRLPRAFDTLRQHWDADPSPAMRRTLLLPIALVRSDDAFDFLLQVARTSDVKTAIQAISALSLYVNAESVGKIREVVTARGDADILARFDKDFGRFSE